MILFDAIKELHFSWDAYVESIQH